MEAELNAMQALGFALVGATSAAASANPRLAITIVRNTRGGLPRIPHARGPHE